MKISDKAAQADQPEIRLAGQDCLGVYELASDELQAADELTDEDQFPDFGHFAKVEKPTGGVSGWDDTETMHLECPGSFAKDIERLDVKPGDAFRIEQITKPGNSYKYKLGLVERE